MARSYHKAQRPLTSFPDLIAAGCLVPGLYLSQTRALSHAPAGITLLRDVNSVSTILSLCRAGFAPALLPAHIQETNPDFIVQTDITVPALDIWLSYTERARRIKRGEAIISWLKEIFSPSESSWFRQTSHKHTPTPDNA